MTSRRDALQLGALGALGLDGMDDFGDNGSLIGTGMPGGGGVDMATEPEPAAIAVAGRGHALHGRRRAVDYRERTVAARSRVAMTEVPWPAQERTSSEPPATWTVSRMMRRPRWLLGGSVLKSKPQPLS